MDCGDIRDIRQVETDFQLFMNNMLINGSGIHFFEFELILPEK